MDPQDDPREGGTSLGDERTTLLEFLRCQRLTLQIKCDGLDPVQLASRAVEPSTMSLLGLLRHMAEVERSWFRRRFAVDLLPTDKSGGFPSRLGCLVGGFHRPRRNPGLYRVQADPLCPEAPLPVPPHSS